MAGYHDDLNNSVNQLYVTCPHDGCWWGEGYFMILVTGKKRGVKNYVYIATAQCINS